MSSSLQPKYLNNIAEHIEKLGVYVAGKPIEETAREYNVSKIIKLASNENPLGPSEKIRQKMAEHAKEMSLYPDGAAWNLKSALAKKFDLSMDHFLVGNGSNEPIELLTRIFREGENWTHSFAYSFVAYRLCALAQKHRYVETPLGEGFQPDPEKLLKEIDSKKSRLVFWANPNNPTGVLSASKKVEFLLENLAEEVILIVDEAYHEYVDSPDYRSMVPLIKSHPNLGVLRTFSKAYGLAGLRVGYLMAQPELLKYLNKFRQPFNCNLVAQQMAFFALQDKEHIQRTVQLNATQKLALEKAYKELDLAFIPSQGNFHLVDFKKPFMPIYELLLREGVILRPMKGYGLENYSRISIGTEEENLVLIQALKKVLG